MKVLVIGSGAREHALVWKIAQSEKVSKIYCAPGNGGIGAIAECVNIKANDIDTLMNFALEKNIDLTVVGPEDPLVAGIVDKFHEAGLKIFGPNKIAAQFEGSKAFSKDFMKKYNIPTAQYMTFNNTDEALEGLNAFSYPVVIKADGLAAGKGVVICSSCEEAKNTINEMIEDKIFGEAGSSIVMEEYLEGIEASLLCFVAGNKIIPMESARDYKKIYDEDKGPNTGGMGSFSPNTIFTDELLKNIRENILVKIEKGFNNENIDFNGILFIGLMISEGESKVLEFNVRFGDPETEVVLPRLRNDIIDIFEKTMDGTLEESELKWTAKKCLCVIAASGGYPIEYEKGKKITGINKTDNEIIVFHGGTKKVDESVVTNGGRVLAVTAYGDTLEQAREKVYENIERINFEKIYFRNDIGKI